MAVWSPKEDTKAACGRGIGRESIKNGVLFFSPWLITAAPAIRRHLVSLCMGKTASGAFLRPCDVALPPGQKLFGGEKKDKQINVFKEPCPSCPSGSWRKLEPIPGDIRQNVGYTKAGG